MSEIDCATPRDVVEEWTLLALPPPREVLVLRLEYAPRGASCVIVPPVLGARTVESLRVVGAVAPGLRLTRDASGATLLTVPEGLRQQRSLRIEVRASGSLDGVRFDRVTWPAPAPDAREARRRTVSAPAPWVEQTPDAWTCQDAPLRDASDRTTRDPAPAFCVSTAPAPAPLTLHVPHEPASARAVVLSMTLALLLGIASTRIIEREDRLRGVLSLLGGSASGATLGYALSATHLAPRVAAVSALAFAGGVLGLVAAQGALARAVGGVGLLAVCLASLLDGRRGFVLAVASSAALALVTARVIDRAPAAAREPPS